MLGGIGLLSALCKRIWRSRERPTFSRALAPANSGARASSRVVSLFGRGRRQNGKRRKFERAGYAGPQLGPFYEIASEGVVKGQNFLGGSRRSGARACGFLGGGRAAQG